MAKILTQVENPDGLHQHYIVQKADGSPVNEKAVYFVLRLDSNARDMQHVRACREAARVYCQNAPKHMQVPAAELDELLDRLEATPTRKPTKAPTPNCVACAGLGHKHPDLKGSACHVCQ